MPPITNPLPPDNQVQELIRVHQHGHPILPRILQLDPSLFCTKDHIGAIQIIPPVYKANLLLHILHQFLYSGYFTDRAALYYFFHDPAILLPGNFSCQLLPGSVTTLPGAINNSISIIEAHFHSSEQTTVCLFFESLPFIKRIPILSIYSS